MDDRGSLCQVSPFRNPRIIGYLLLPVAYRSLSRLSSALSAKASTLRPYQLDLILLTVTVKMVFILTVILVPASDIALSFTGFLFAL